jgi:hypothetical protein
LSGGSAPAGGFAGGADCGAVADPLAGAAAGVAGALVASPVDDTELDFVAHATVSTPAASEATTSDLISSTPFSGL